MNAEARSLQGVSGSGTLPDQGAVWNSAKAEGPIRQSCDAKKERAQKLRICLPAHTYARYRALAPRERARAIAAVLGSVEAGIDLGKLIEATTELRRLGVLLNQSVRLAHLGRAALDYIERVEAVVRAVEALRP